MLLEKGPLSGSILSLEIIAIFHYALKELAVVKLNDELRAIVKFCKTILELPQTLKEGEID